MKEIELNEKVQKEIDEQEKKFNMKLKKRKSKYLFSKSFTSVEGMEETETRSSLFIDPSGPSLEQSEIKKEIMIKPI